MKSNNPLTVSTSHCRFHHLCGAALVAASLWFGCSARAALVLEESFTYADGNLNGQGGWTVSGGTAPATVEAGNLDVAGLPASTGKRIQMDGSAGTFVKGDGTATLTNTVSGNAVYFSYILHITDIASYTTTYETVSEISIAGNFLCLVQMKDNGGGKVKFATRRASGGTPTSGSSNPTPFATNASILIVGKWEVNTGGNDIAKLWVDPDSSTFGAATDPTTDASSTSGGTDPANGAVFGGIRFTSGINMEVDSVRIGRSWADVTSAGVPQVGAKLTFTTSPAGAAPGATMSPVVVQVQSAGGVNVASNGVPVTLTLTAGSGILSGTVTQNTDANGAATFSNLSIDTAGSGKQLTATASGIGAGLSNAVSSTFTIATPSVATKLAFTTQPADALVNVAMNSVVVQIQDASSVNVASNNVPITLTLTSGTGTLGGTTTVNSDVTGKATFSTLTVDTAGAGKQLTAAASGIGAGLTSAVSSTFAITNGGGGGGGSPGLNISQTRMLPSGYEVKGTNGTPVTFAQIIGSPSLTLPLTNWLLVAYDNLDGSGNITFTNPTSIAMPLAYYRLRTGNTVTKLEPPSIPSVTAPQSQIVSPGATASFTVGATGPLLQYLWLFNNVPIKNATNTTLIIPNAQAGNVGNYQVIVANPGGSVTSPIATLGVGNVGPTITMQPQPQTNNAGGTAIFTIAATGTLPLSYQWYTNVSTPLTDKTNTQLILPNITTNDAGNYRCVVSNPYGVAPSIDAHLTVNPVPTGLPDTNVLGWAAFANVTGGAGGAEVTVSDYTALRAACRAAGPLIIHVEGIITPNEDYCYIEGRDKTIVGVGTNAGLSAAGFRPAGTNIIIANLSFNSFNPNSDGVTIDGNGHGVARGIWVDHCTFYDSTDGSVDVTKGADYVTVSWCKFYYAPVPTGTVNHEFVNLIGSSDSDNPGGIHYHVTFHHNWYSSYCRERMPSVRFGHVHVFNNYYDCFDNNYCVRTRIDAEVLVENNYFINVHNPWERFVTSGADGKLFASGNITNNCTFVSGWVSGAVVIPGNDVLGADLNPPPYTYTLTPAADVPFYAQTYCGNGKYPYAP